MPQPWSCQDPQGQLKLFKRFLDIDNRKLEGLLTEITGKIQKSRKDLLEAQQRLADIEDEFARLPKLQEQGGQLKELGLEEKLKIIPKLEQEKHLSDRTGNDLDDVAFRQNRHTHRRRKEPSKVHRLPSFPLRVILEQNNRKKDREKSRPDFQTDCDVRKRDRPCTE